MTANSKDQNRRVPFALSALSTALLMGLAYTPNATAGSCDSFTNTIFGFSNEACGFSNTVGGTFGSTAPDAAPLTVNNTGFGIGNRASNGYSTAFGYENYATAVYSTAMGGSNEARGRDSTAVGNYNKVGMHPGNGNDGAGSSAFGVSNIIGTPAGDPNGGHSTAIGGSNDVFGTRSTAVGYYNHIGSAAGAAQGTYYQKSTAIGYQNWVYGDNSIAMGSNTEVGGSDTLGGPGIIANKAVAIGSDARARQDGTIAIGDTALAGMSAPTLNGGISYASYNSIAIGTNAKVYGTATTTGLGSIAIGWGAESTGDSSVAFGENSIDGGQSNVVSVGNATTQRRIINVAAGTASTDAVNVSQLNTLGTSTATALGTGSYNASTNSITGIDYVVGGSHFTSVAGAVGALQSYNPSGYFAASGIGVASAAAADATAMGANSLAQGNFSVAAGNGAFATGNNSSALGSGTTASGVGSTAVGYNATASGTNASAMGFGAIASGNSATAVGAGAVSSGNGSIAIGQNSSDGGQSNVVSVGNSTTQRRITNVAAGTAPTDAVNLNQLNSAMSSTNRALSGMQDQVNENKAGIAGVTAAVNLPGLAAGQKYNLGVAYGNYLAYSAIAIGGHARISENVSLKISGSASGGVYSGGAGLAIGF